MSGDDPTGGSQDALPLPEYEVSQYFPRDMTLTGEEKRRLREEYGFVRAYFKTRVDEHRTLQRSLNQGRFGVTYDIYLQWSVYYSVGTALVGIVLGYLLAQTLAALGVFAGIHSPVPVSGTGIFGVVAANKTTLGIALVTVLFGATFGLLTWGGRYYYPRLVVDTRRRNITFLLPNAIVMMYALSEGGMTLVEIVHRIADADDAYDEVAYEFQTVVRDMELFGSDLYTALRNLRNLTPSDNLEQFVDDMLSVMESGGDVASFFEEESQRYLQDATESQEDFLEFLSIMSEVFIVAFVAAPLFLVVILLVISVLSGSQLLQLSLLIYAVFPLGMAGFMVLLSTLSEPYVYPKTELRIDEEFDFDAPVAHPDYEGYRRTKRLLKLRDFLGDPLRAVREQPRYALLVSVPIALGWLWLAVTVGGLPTGYESLIRRPIQLTTNLIVVPFLITVVPFSFFHELKRGRQEEVSRRFPETLNILSSANNMGIQLADALDIIARWSGGWVARELRTLRNDMQWNNDLPSALLRFANRLSVPQASLTLKLVAEAVSSTQDLSKVLRVAAEDTRNRYRLVKNRRRAMTSYIAVVVIGFLVYLLVILLLDASFLEPIATLTQTGGADQQESPVSLQRLPIGAYRLLFYHSVLIQGIGCGLLTGQLADNDVRTGLKYSVLLVAIATVIFQLV
jgi:flagellar protein FlaJ